MVDRLVGLRNLIRRVGRNNVTSSEVVGDLNIAGNLTVNGVATLTEEPVNVVETAITNNATTDLGTFSIKSTGTPAANFGGRVALNAETTTTEDTPQSAITTKWATATHASRAGSVSLGAYTTSTLQQGVEVQANSVSVRLGFFGTTPAARGAAIVQTYATATRTLAAYAADDESAAYTGQDNAQIGSVYAKVVDLNALRVAVENLRAFVENGVQVLNAVIDDNQATGLLQ